MTEPKGILFSHFVSLVEKMGSVKPHQQSGRGHTTFRGTHAISVFRQFKACLCVPLRRGESRAIFRMLFPEEDHSRRYDMQERKLAQMLISVMNLSHNEGACLLKWSENSYGHMAAGCLGLELQRVLLLRSQPTMDHNSPTLLRIDTLLDELASTSAFSAPSDPPTRRGTKHILGDLFMFLSPWESACLAQIILRDIRPLLYPLPSENFTSALLSYNSKAYSRLTLQAAMRVWHPLMFAIYGRTSSIVLAATMIEDLEPSCTERDFRVPVGLAPMKVPKCVKGTSCEGAIGLLRNGGLIWAETKYDGERVQIHVDTSLEFRRQIRIFSKSGRDSTLDRIACHSIIREALNIRLTDECGRDPQTSVILDAEMVAFSEETQTIDEFWRIRSLIEESSRGHRWRLRNKSTPTATQDSQCSIVSDISNSGIRHLMLIFFDILHFNGIDLLHHIYRDRRGLLEKTIHSQFGKAMIAQRREVGDPDVSSAQTLRTLCSAFAQSRSKFEEGVVLKLELSKYNDERWPWVKLKADYIPGCGDSVDLVCFGAGWSKDRARDLNVGTDTYTDFLVGTLADDGELNNHPLAARAHICGVFSVSWARSRAELEELNFLIRSEFVARDYNGFCSAITSYSVENLGTSATRPSVLFEHPVLCEVYGAGFTKARGQSYYEIRFPRISKVWRESERPWMESITASELHNLALQTIGRDSTKTTLAGLVDKHWGDAPTVPDSRKEQAIMDKWMGILSSGKQQSSEVAASTPQDLLCAEQLQTSQTAPSSSSSTSMKSVPGEQGQSVAGSFVSIKPKIFVRSSASLLGWNEFCKAIDQAFVFIDKGSNSRPHWWSLFRCLVPKSKRVSTLSALFCVLDSHDAADFKGRSSRCVAFISHQNAAKFGCLHTLNPRITVFSLEELYDQLSHKCHPYSTFQLSPLGICGPQAAME